MGFIGADGIQLLLIGTFGLVYFLSRQNARKELAIATTLFPRDRIPDDWSAKGRLGVGLWVVMFMGLYWALATYVDNVRVVTLIMSVVACSDWRGRYLIDKNMKRYFAEEKYAPRPSDSDRKRIEERRRIVSDYLSKLPHMWKEGGRAAGCGIAFAVAMYVHAKSPAGRAPIAYIVLIGTLLLNEVITVRWRLDRDSQLERVEQGG